MMDLRTGLVIIFLIGLFSMLFSIVATSDTRVQVESVKNAE